MGSRQNFKQYYPIGNIIAINLENFSKKKKNFIWKDGLQYNSKKRAIDIDSTDDLEIVRKIMRK